MHVCSCLLVCVRLCLRVCVCFCLFVSVCLHFFCACLLVSVCICLCSLVRLLVCFPFFLLTRLFVCPSVLACLCLFVSPRFFLRLSVLRSCLLFFFPSVRVCLCLLLFAFVFLRLVACVSWRLRMCRCSSAFAGACVFAFVWFARLRLCVQGAGRRRRCEEIRTRQLFPISIEHISGRGEEGGVGEEREVRTLLVCLTCRIFRTLKEQSHGCHTLLTGNE